MADGKVVELSYDELTDPASNLSDRIAAAYGKEGLGILSVSGVPKVAELRARLLPLASKLAALPDDVKESISDVDSSYSFGWSHGKEMLANGVPDYHKGSFYANPQYDTPTADPAEIQAHPSYARPNIWPEQHVPDLEPAFKELGQLMVTVGALVANRCDIHVQRHWQHASENGGGNISSRLENIIRSSKCAKGRLLHYFPVEEPSAAAANDLQDSWCGWHTDHGSLTALCCGAYLREEEEVPCPDHDAGLYIRNRRGKVVKASFPCSHIAYQIGEASQIHSGWV